MWISVLALIVFANLYDGVKSSPLPVNAVKADGNTFDIGSPDVHSEAMTRDTPPTNDLAMLNPGEVNIGVGDGLYPEGSVIRIVCNTDGYPISTVLWYKDGNLFQPNDRTTFSGFELIIIGAVKNDSGKYRCEAANEYTSGAETSDIEGDAPNQSINPNRPRETDRDVVIVRHRRWAGASAASAACAPAVVAEVAAAAAAAARAAGGTRTAAAAAAAAAVAECGGCVSAMAAAAVLRAGGGAGAAEVAVAEAAAEAAAAACGEGGAEAASG